MNLVNQKLTFSTCTSTRYFSPTGIRVINLKWLLGSYHYYLHTSTRKLFKSGIKNHLWLNKEIIGIFTLYHHFNFRSIFSNECISLAVLPIIVERPKIQTEFVNTNTASDWKRKTSPHYLATIFILYYGFYS